jgi:hypothetical protein
MRMLGPLLLLLIGASWETLVHAILLRPFAGVIDFCFWVLDLGFGGMGKLNKTDNGGRLRYSCFFSVLTWYSPVEQGRRWSNFVMMMH